MNIFEELVKLLIEKKLTVSAAESCTGGLFASEIVRVPNTSSVLEASFVTYSERAKTEIAGVDAEIIKSFGVVSEKTAIEMAKGASEKAHSDIGVGITGYAGPATDENDDTVGTVCFGFFVNGKTVSSTKHFGDIGRNAVREFSVIYAAQTLIKLINTFGDK